MASAPCTPSLQTYYTLDWLDKVPAMKKIYGKLTNYQSGSVSFTMANHLKNNQYFRAYLLPSADCLHKKIQKIRIKTKRVVMRPDIKGYPTVISMFLAPCMPHLHPYSTLDWLDKVPVTKKFYGQLMNYQSGLISFTMENHLKTTNISELTSSLKFIDFKNKSRNSRLRKNCLVVRPNINKIFPTVRSMALAPCTPPFRPYCTL